MDTKTENGAVAIYWDFDNIQASLVNQAFGADAFKTSQFRQHEPVIDFGGIMNFAASLGSVAINKAFANWQWYARYAEALNAYGFRLHQLFPRGPVKNGADIELVLEVVDDIQRYPNLTHILVIGGDSDYIALAHRVKQSGKKIIGVGVRETTSRFWICNCSEFFFYGSMPGEEPKEKKCANTIPLPAIPQSTSSQQGCTPELGRALLIRVLQSFANTSQSLLVPRSTIKLTLQQLNPGFKEASFGFSSFSAFLSAFPDLVELITNSSGGAVLIKQSAPLLPNPLTDRIEADKPILTHSVQNYQALLKRRRIRPLPPAWVRQALPHLERLFFEAPNHFLPSLSVMKERLSEKLSNAGLVNDPAMINKLKLNLFALRMFDLGGEQGIHLAISPTAEGTELIKQIELHILNTLEQLLGQTPDRVIVDEMLLGLPPAGGNMTRGTSPADSDASRCQPISSKAQAALMLG